MNVLTFNEIQAVAGGNGMTNSEADKIIGKSIGDVIHGMKSTEALIGGLFGPVGFVAGAVLHFKLKH